MQTILIELIKLLEKADTKHYHQELIESAILISRGNPQSYRAYEMISALNSALRQSGYYM